jgi:hypothetical protein
MTPMKPIIRVTVSETEREAVAKRAREQGRSVASYIRWLILQDIPALILPEKADGS